VKERGEALNFARICTEGKIRRNKASDQGLGKPNGPFYVLQLSHISLRRRKAAPVPGAWEGERMYRLLAVSKERRALPLLIR